MPSSNEIKQEMKKTTSACITRGAVGVIIDYYNNFITEEVKKKELIAEEKGEKTVGIKPGLSSSKIMRFSREHTKLNISSAFVEEVKKSLSDNIKVITKRAEGIAIDKGRKSIMEDDVRQSIEEIRSSGKYEVSVDDDITPQQIESSAQRELGIISDESIEVISNHLTWYLGKIYSSIIATAKSRGRKKGNIKLEDVLDGVSRDSTNDVPDVPDVPDVSVCDPDVE